MHSPMRPDAVAFLALALLVPLTGCTTGDGPTGPRWDANLIGDLLPPSEIDTVVLQAYSGFDEPTRAVVRTQEEWAELWEHVHRNVSPTPERPDVDLTASVLVVAAMGTRPSGGHAIRIEAVSRDGDDLYVGVEQRSPGMGCVVTAALTQPVVVVRVPATGGEVRFVEESITTSC